MAACARSISRSHGPSARAFVATLDINSAAANPAAIPDPAAVLPALAIAHDPACYAVRRSAIAG